MYWMRRTRVIVTATALLALALAGCGGAATARVAPTATRAAPTPTYPPYTPQPTAIPGSQLMTCADLASNLPQQPLQHVRIGDAFVTQYKNNLSFTIFQIPGVDASKPLALTDPNTLSPTAIAVNPQLQGASGYYFSLCDTSTTTAITVQAISVRIASFTPYTGALAAWDSCSDRYYDASARQVSGGGCGGGLAVSDATQANFAANAGVGATVTAQQVNGMNGSITTIPFTAIPVAPGHGFTFTAGITTPTTPGTYTFAIGVALDNAAPAYITMSAPVVIAPVTQKWTGQNCLAASMQSQIPTSAQGDYICPPAA